MAAADDSREVFVNSLLALVRSKGLDGVDIDWEAHLNPRDWENFSDLLLHVRAGYHFEF